MDRYKLSRICYRTLYNHHFFSGKKIIQTSLTLIFHYFATRLFAETISR